MRSSACTRNSSDGSKPKPFCRQPTPLRCCSGRCWPQDRSTCVRWMVGKPSPQNPSINRLTLPLETIPSCSRRMRHTEFQPHFGRHLDEPMTVFDIEIIMWHWPPPTESISDTRERSACDDSGGQCEISESEQY